MKQKRKVIICILIIFIIIISIFLLLKDNKKEKKVVKEKKEESVWKKSVGNSSLINIYFDKYYGSMIASKDTKENNDEYTLIKEYKCYYEDCNSYGFDEENNYIIIKDDDYLIFNYKNGLYKKINLSKNVYNNIEFLSYDKKIYGLAVSNNYDKYAFYDIKQEKFTTDFIYNEILKDDVASLLDGNFIAVDDNYRYNIINYKSGNIVNSFNNYIGSIGNKKTFYYYEKIEDKYIFYDHDFNLLLGENSFMKYGVSSKGNIALSKDLSSYSIYNKDGILVKSSKPYKQIFLIFNDYIVIEDNDEYLKIIDYDGNVISKITSLSNKTIDLSSCGFKYINGKNLIYLSLFYNDKKNIYYYNIDYNVLESYDINQLS